MRKGAWDNQALEEIEIDKDLHIELLVKSELMLTLGWSLTLKSESRSKLSGDRGGSWVGQVGFKLEVKVVVKVDIRTEEVQAKLLV